jgi:hypothetical protein
MTALNFYPVTNPPGSNCSVCWEKLDNGKLVVAHEVGEDGSDGALHPLHLGCLKSTLIYSDRCPACQNEIEIGSALALKERSITPFQTFVTNGIIGTIAGLSFGELSQRAVEIGFASIPVIATLAQEMVSSDPGVIEAAVIGLGVAGGFGVAALVTGGVVLGSFALAREIKTSLESSEFPSEIVSEDAQAFGLLSGAIVSLVNSTPSGAVAAGIIAGSISVLKPDLLRRF